MGKENVAPYPQPPKSGKRKPKKASQTLEFIILFGYNSSKLDFPKSHVLHDFFFEVCKGWFLFQSENVLIKGGLRIKSGHTYTSVSTKIARNTVFQGPTQSLIFCIAGIPYLRVSLHIDKMNNYFFKKLIHFNNLKLFNIHDLLWYCHMSSEIYSECSYDNHDGFSRCQLHLLTKIHLTTLRIIS
jgi:hypothetical protein